MAVRQYIGARYVPLYVGDWDNTRNYEPLSIVTDANGNSFTSRKDVPAGTPLNDRDYWIQTSSFSGAVDVLQRRVNDLESVVSEKPRKIVFISDSYGRPDIPGIGTVWHETIKTMLPSNYETEAFYQGGLGFGWEQSSASLFNNFIRTTVIPSITFRAEEVTDIIIVGGANDGNLLQLGNTTQSTIQRNAIDAIHELRGTFKNAIVSLAFVGARYVDPGNEDIYRMHYINASFSWDQAGKIAKGGASVENAKYVMTNNSYIEDANIHPNAAGSYQIALSIAQYIKNGSLSVYYSMDNIAPEPFNNTISFDSDARMRQILSNGTATIALYRPQSNFRVNFPSPITIPAGRFEQPIIKLPRGIFRGMTDRIPNASSAVNVGISGGGTQIEIGGLMVFNGYIYLQVYSTQAINNVGAIVIMNPMITVESEYR